jgi:hypothetical protein
VIRLAADENLHGDILRAILRHYPDIDIVRIQDTEAYQTPDPVMLEWVANERRILLTHDKGSISFYAKQRIEVGQYFPGVFIIKTNAPLGKIIDDLIAIIGASTMEEWENLVKFLPF